MPQCACFPFETALLRATSLPWWGPSVPAFPLKQPFSGLPAFHGNGPSVPAFPLKQPFSGLPAFHGDGPSVPAFPLKQPFSGPPAFHGEAPVCLLSLWNSPSQGYQPSMVMPQCACIPFETALLRATSLPWWCPSVPAFPFETALLRATSLPWWGPSVPAFPLKQPFSGLPAFHGDAPVCLHFLWNSPSQGYQPSMVMPQCACFPFETALLRATSLPVMPQCACIPFETALLRATSLPWWWPQCACIPFETALLRATSLPWWGPSVPAFPLKQPFSGLPAFHGDGPSVPAFPLKQPFSGLPAFHGDAPVCLLSLWNSPSQGYQPSTVMPQCACIPFETALLRATSLLAWCSREANNNTTYSAVPWVGLATPSGLDNVMFFKDVLVFMGKIPVLKLCRFVTEIHVKAFIHMGRVWHVSSTCTWGFFLNKMQVQHNYVKDLSPIAALPPELFYILSIFNHWHRH